MITSRPVDDFSNLAPWPLADVRRLLVEGEGIEQAWAAWELALRIGRESDVELAAVASTSPTPGVRSLLLVMVAGSGDRALLKTFATADPDADVRAAAVRLLAGTRREADDSIAGLLIDRMTADTSPVVRNAVLVAAFEHDIDLPSHLVVHCLDDRDVRTRGSAFALLAQRQFDLSVNELLGPAVLEPDRDLRMELQGYWVAHNEPIAVIRALSGVIEAPRPVSEILGLLAGAGATIPWTALEPLTNDDPSTDTEISKLIQLPLPNGAMSWLFRVALRPQGQTPKVLDSATAHQAVTIGAASTTALAVLRKGLGRPDRPKLHGLRDRLHALRLRGWLMSGMAEGRAESMEDDGVDLDGLDADQQPEWYRDAKALVGSLDSMLRWRHP